MFLSSRRRPSTPASTGDDSDGGAGTTTGRIPPPPGGPPLPAVPSRPPPFSAPATSTAAGPGAGGGDGGGGVDATSPPPLKRRAFSVDCETRREKGGLATVGAGARRAAKTGGGGLRTIPSRGEMQGDRGGGGDGGGLDGNMTGNGDESDGGDGRTSLRRTLFSTPPRVRPLPPGNFQNRGRAVSCDVVLEISQDCLPRYNDVLASRIANVSGTEGNALEEANVIGNAGGRRGEAPPSSSSFSTPERPIARPSRAYTFPHMPQRRSLSQRHGGDEESGMLMVDHSGSSETEGFRIAPETAPSSAPGEASSSTPGGTTRRSPGESANDTMLHRSPDRRGRSSSSLLRTPQTPPRATPSGRLTTSSAWRPSPSQSLPAQNSATPSDAATPHVPQVANGRPSPTAVRAVPSADLRRPRDCFLRVHPAVMKLLMVLSLYVLLSYAWDTDLRFRLRSAEVNYGLSEYWHGGIGAPDRTALAVGRMGRDIPGTLFNDDVGDDRGVARLIQGLGVDDSGSTSDSGDSASGAPGEEGPRRPSLSRARALPSHRAYMYGRRRAAVARPRPKKGWTPSRVAWCLVWAAFAIPVAEAAWREARRQANFRLWGARRLRGWRAGPSARGGRATNVHYL